MSKSNQGISLAMFGLSTPVTLVAYGISGEPLYVEVFILLTITCAMVTILPMTVYTPYERREMEPPINPDNESEPDWLDEIKNLNYEITPPKHHTYAQQLASDPCPQG